MAYLRGILLLLVLLVPSAVAQVPALPAPEAPPTIVVDITPFSGAVMPGGLSQTTSATIDVSCALVATSPQTGLAVMFETNGPSWASVIADPPGVYLDPRGCSGPTMRVPVTLAARGGHAGRAGDMGDVTLTATTTTPAGAQSGAGSTPLTLGYSGSIDVKASATRASLKSFETGTVTITVKNTGNARSVVGFTLSGTDALKADPVMPFGLDPQQTVEKVVTFHSTKEVGPSGQTDPLTINATSARDGTGEIGSWKKVEVIVSTFAAPQEVKEKQTPAPAAGLVALVVGLVVLARRTRP